MGFQLHWENRGVVKRYFGRVSAEELIAPVIATEADPRFDRLRYVINDFLDITSVTFTQIDVDEIAAYDMGAALTNPHIKVAVVVARADVIDLVSRYIKASGMAYPTRTFFTMEEARAWVAEPSPGWPVTQL